MKLVKIQNKNQRRITSDIVLYSCFVETDISAFAVSNGYVTNVAVEAAMEPTQKRLYGVDLLKM